MCLTSIINDLKYLIKHDLHMHYRIGHINEKHIKKLQKIRLLDKFDLESIDTCESYLREKKTKTSFSKRGERTSDLLDFIHTDVCGLMSTCARNNYYYFITFTDITSITNPRTK
jgi:GAG-pre-integrase domain